MSSNIIVEIKKNAREVIRVTVDEFNGHQGVQVRNYFKDGEEGKWLPTKRGVWLDVEAAREVLKALPDAIERLVGRAA